MKRKLILIIGVVFLISCKEQVAKLLFDTSQMSNQTNFFYEYDADKLIRQTEKDYTIMFGQVVDSMITHIDFKYNDKGLLVREIWQSDFEDKPTIEIYDYDNKDSLISRISISPENDTTLWEVYKYYPDGRKTVFHRFLRIHLDPNQNIMEAMDNIKLDTSYYLNEFEYDGNLCKTQRQFDKQGNLIKTVNFEYTGIQLAKEIHLSYYNKMELKDKIKFYDYSKSDKKPDYFSVDTKNHTLEFCINVFDSDKLVKVANMFDYGSIYSEEYYESDLLVGTVDYDRQFSMEKIIYLYEYDENGLLKTKKSYREKINAH